MKKSFKSRKKLKTAGTFLAIVAGGIVGLHAQSIEQLQKENEEMHKRLDALEDMMKKEGLLPSGKAAPKFVSALSDITLSGFVTASYFHDTSDPPGGISPGYLWNRHNNSFSLNKVKLTLASKPVESNGDHFEAGFRTSLIFGQDAPIVNSGSGITGFDVLREAYVDLNIPIGTGLNVKAGELISLLNYESGDGGAVNDNFSQGFQWFFTGNGPAAGVQVGYNVCEQVDLKFRVQNGLYAGPVDNNSSKTLVGAIGIHPTKSLWFSLIGWGGREDSFIQSVWGGSLLAGWQATEQLHFGTELDYFDFYNGTGVTPAGNSDVWSTGLWAAYDFTKQVGLAVRGEFLSDKNGADISGGALGFGNPPGTGQDLASVAVTLNYRPLPSIKVQPEVRYDHSSYNKAFGTENHRVLVGAGVSYLF
jgi:hypothetical protein